MKLIKIRFTAWRDEGAARRTPAFQRQLDYWNTRVNVLSCQAEDLAVQRAHADSDGLQKALARIIAERQRVEAERTLLLSAEMAERNVATSEEREHMKVGTFGYQVFDDPGTHLISVVDEDGNELPETAVVSYELVEALPLTARAMKRVGRS